MPWVQVARRGWCRACVCMCIPSVHTTQMHSHMHACCAAHRLLEAGVGWTRSPSRRGSRLRSLARSSRSGSGAADSTPSTWEGVARNVGGGGGVRREHARRDADVVRGNMHEGLQARVSQGSEARASGGAEVQRRRGAEAQRCRGAAHVERRLLQRCTGLGFRLEAVHEYLVRIRVGIRLGLGLPGSGSGSGWG